MNIRFFKIFGLIDSFYSKRILQFSNKTLNYLNSNICELLVQGENFELDFKILNPSVFNMLLSLETRGKVKSVDPNLFLVLTNVNFIIFQSNYLVVVWVGHMSPIF